MASANPYDVTPPSPWGARSTLVRKGDLGGDSPSLARDAVKGTRSPERLERCSALMEMK